ncbi:hypothetical protein GCM10009425_47020 [Pseudomonas asuensis]|uniref:HEAT repeat domain-containing protein n=1 Tax=Pseudomonas asuensis TaxID=1825787 RepID=A0ABQ2H5C6_9PSED|nr:hypothetical protein [Pseudomonas asuensis]GGM30964.1 hypothetical protein GCM10009425_47020 [Pseudomonas asuensis]
MTGTDHGQPAQHSSLDSQARHDTWRETLKAIIAPIDNLPERIGRPGLADDILTYLLEGASPAVLTELSQRPRVGMYLNVLNQTGAVIYHHDWRAHYQSLQVAPAGVLLRWARVLEAFTWSHANKLMFSIDMPDGSRWTETLMLHSLNVTLDGHSTVRPSRQGIALDVIETLLREVNLSPAAFLEAAFARPKPYWLNTGRLLSITCLEGYSVAVTRHAACLRPHVLAKPLERRLHAMTLLKNLDDHDLQVFSKEIVELAVSESKQVQGSAQDMLFRIPQAAMEPLRQVATAATPEQRKLALGLIWTMARAEEDTAQLTFALEMARADKAASVRALVQEWELAEQTQHEQPAYTVPPVSWNHEMTPAFAAALDTLWSELNQLFVQRHEQSHEYRQTLQNTGRKKPAPQLDEIELGRLKHLLTLPGSELSAASVGRGFRYYLGHFHPGMLYPAFALFVHSQVVSPTELFKVLFFFNLIMQAECISNARDSTRKSGLASVAIRLFGALYESTGRPSLLELSEMLKASGYPSEAVLYACCGRWTSEPLPWNAEAVWPYLAEHEQLLTDTLANPDPGNYSLDRSKLFKLAATMPVLPEGLARTLFSLATGSAKGERLEAQATLSHYPGKQVHILTALVDGKAETRIAAAQWLGRLGDKQAIPNLEKALAKEKMILSKATSSMYWNSWVSPSSNI